MQQRGGGLVGHACVPVGCSGHNTFEKPQHAAHLGLPVEGGDEVHFRSAGIGETDVDIVFEKCIAKNVGAVHVTSSSRRLFAVRVRLASCCQWGETTSSKLQNKSYFSSA